MSFFIGLVVGLFLGGFAGVFAISLVSVNSRAEEDLMEQAAGAPEPEEG